MMAEVIVVFDSDLVLETFSAESATVSLCQSSIISLEYEVPFKIKDKVETSQSAGATSHR